MELAPSLLLTLKEHPIQRFDKCTLKWMGARKNPGFEDLVNQLGRLSAKARGLHLSSHDHFSNLIDSEKTLYVYWEPIGEENKTNRVIGFAKVAKSRLYLRNPENQSFIHDPLCFMDFYICPTVQRHGYGKKLFDYILEKEGVKAEECAFDNPTATFLSFLQKNYNLVDPIRQSNRFVVYEAFFETLEPELDNSDEFSISSSRLNSQRSSISSPLKSTRSETVDELIHRNFEPRQRRSAKPESAEGRKYERDFCHQNLW
ncbi:N-acetyltransferase domain-containing protein [Aphelenchoides besseyi]|nr:N-acetyltransferase domain-containing protein [Aphelenchoides besseyi]